MEKLSEKELNELKGGTDEPVDTEVKNTNNTALCYCLYNNRPSDVINTNNISGCVCKCGL